jgi:hypothetical protein
MLTPARLSELQAHADAGGKFSHENAVELLGYVLSGPEAGQPVELSGDELPAGMVKISKMIADLQSIMDRFGDTCVYIKPGVSWGATALWAKSDAEKAIAGTADSFAATFKSEYKELAQQIMAHAISEGWTHRFATPEREYRHPLEYCTYIDKDGRRKFLTDFVPQVIAAYELGIRKYTDGQYPGAVYNAMEDALTTHFLDRIEAHPAAPLPPQPTERNEV